jgi:hypothetical protein
MAAAQPDTMTRGARMAICCVHPDGNVDRLHTLTDDEILMPHGTVAMNGRYGISGT